MAALLVSVRDADEAEAALAGGAALIDVKEPANGALGRADDDAVRRVVAAVAGRAPVSAALGELTEAGDVPPGLSFAKYGLAFCARLDWRALLLGASRAAEAAGARLVFVAYADWRRADAPPPDEVFAAAVRCRAAAALIDTWGKDGSTLLDWLSADEACGLCARASAGGVAVALAGSLGVEQVAALRPAGPDWFAVRGAACVGGRGGRIDAALVRRLARAAA